MKPFVTFDNKTNVKIGYSGYDSGKKRLLVIDPLNLECLLYVHRLYIDYRDLVYTPIFIFLD